MILPPIVEARGALQCEPDRTSNGPQDADNLMPVTGRLRMVDRHEVEDLANAILRHEARYEDCRGREVELLCNGLVCGADSEVSPAIPIQQRGKDARGVETGRAEPVDHPVRVDERGGLQVSDEPVVGDRGIFFLARGRNPRLCLGGSRHAIDLLC